MSRLVSNPFHAAAFMVATSLCGAILLPSMSHAQSGEKLFEECVTCHSLEAGKNGVGPSLNGIVGRKIATVDGFRYSNIFKAQKLVWTDELLDRFLTDPQAMFRGNKMPYSGMSDAGQRRALLDWLKEATK